MRTCFFPVGLLVAVAAGSLHTLASAQNCDPATDIILADLSGEQVQPKMVGTPDGGAYVSWFDNATGGYDVRLQRVDGNWNEAFAHNGMLIADRSFSSTQDYDLATTGPNAALLVFRDDRFGGTKVTAQIVSANGATPWGASGIQFADGSAFVANPKIVGASDGTIFVAWINDADLHFQHLNSQGNLLWGSDLVIHDAGGASLSMADLAPSLDGSVIASWVSAASFNSPKHLIAQRIDGDGNLLWGVNGLAIYDGGSLQFGNFPPFTTDGEGGAVFAWYSTSGPNLECLVQHVNAAGNEAYAHNGLTVSTDSSHDRVSPSAITDGTSNTIFVFWMEESNAQANRGVYGQKIDASGNRLWGDTGKVIRPLANLVDYRSISASFSGNPMVSFVESAGFGDDSVRAAGLDADGNLIWSPNVVKVTPGGFGRSRLVAANFAAPGRVGLVWQNGDPADLHAQTVRTATGTLGSVPIDLIISGNCPGVVRVTARDATPGGQVAFVYARGPGSLRIPSGLPCHGVQLCLNATATLGANWRADASGVASLNVNVPAFACGGNVLIQVVDLGTCMASRALPTP